MPVRVDRKPALIRRRCLVRKHKLFDPGAANNLGRELSVRIVHWVAERKRSRIKRLSAVLGRGLTDTAQAENL